MDNTNREQFIIAPLSPGCVSASCVARPDTIIRCREGGRGEVMGGTLRGREGAGEEGANALLMGFIQAWRFQARPPHRRVGVNTTPPHQRPLSPPHPATAATPVRWSTNQSRLQHTSSRTLVLPLSILFTVTVTVGPDSHSWLG